MVSRIAGLSLINTIKLAISYKKVYILPAAPYKCTDNRVTASDSIFSDISKASLI